MWEGVLFLSKRRRRRRRYYATKDLRAVYWSAQRTRMRSSFKKPVGIGETVADDAERRFFEPPSNDGDVDDDEHEKDIICVVPKHTTTLDCVPGDDCVDENVKDVDAELYATKVRNDALEQSHRVLVRNENALLVEARHYESACKEKDREIEQLKTRLLCAEEASSSKRRAREEDERARKMVERKTKATMKETLRLLEKTTSALELTRKENEVLGLKLEKSHRPKTEKKEKKKEKKKRTTTTTTTASRGRTPLPETPPFAKKFWSYRNEEKRGLHEEERTHPLRFFVNDVEEEEEDDDEEEVEEEEEEEEDDDDFYSDDFYSDDDDDNEEDTTTTSSSSYSSSSEDEDEDEDENRRRAAAADTSYSSIDELLDRSVVLNSRLEALEQRARHLATASSKPPDASSKQTE